MEKYSGGNWEGRYDSSIPPREDNYRYYYFASGDFPWGERLIAQIQAQSYVNMQIVRPEAVITIPDPQGKLIQILSPSASNPSGDIYEAPRDSHVEYALGVEKNSSDFSVETGRLVGWKKLYASLDELPAYQFCKQDLSKDEREYLRDADGHQHIVMVEPEALGKTANAERGAVKEFIRAELQRAYGKGEVWFMGLVEKTVYESWVHNWGPKAIRKIGAAKKLAHPYSHDNVMLVPTVVDVDNFYANMAEDILNPINESNNRFKSNFIYMTDGMSDRRLGTDLAEFRCWVQKQLQGEVA